MVSPFSITMLWTTGVLSFSLVLLTLISPHAGQNSANSPKKCYRLLPIDFYFLVDISASVFPNIKDKSVQKFIVSFMDAIDFEKEILGKGQLDTPYHRIRITSFSSKTFESKTDKGLTTSKSTVKTQIRETIGFINDKTICLTTYNCPTVGYSNLTKGTNIYKPLMEMVATLGSAGARADRSVIILISDGYQDEDIKTPAKDARDKLMDEFPVARIVVIAVDVRSPIVGGIEKKGSKDYMVEKLRALASDPIFFFSTSDYEQLKTETMNTLCVMLECHAEEKLVCGDDCYYETKRTVVDQNGQKCENSTTTHNRNNEKLACGKADECEWPNPGQCPPDNIVRMNCGSKWVPQYSNFTACFDEIEQDCPEICRTVVAELATGKITELCKNPKIFCKCIFAYKGVELCRAAKTFPNSADIDALPIGAGYSNCKNCFKQQAMFGGPRCFYFVETYGETTTGAPPPQLAGKTTASSELEDFPYWVFVLLVALVVVALSVAIVVVLVTFPKKKVVAKVARPTSTKETSAKSVAFGPGKSLLDVQTLGGKTVGGKTAKKGGNLASVKSGISKGGKSTVTKKKGSPSKTAKMGKPSKAAKGAKGGASAKTKKPGKLREVRGEPSHATSMTTTTGTTRK